MDSFGFIHGELDIKILILFVLRRLSRPVDGHTLSELCSCDTGIGWFDYTECLYSLVETDHVDEMSGDRYLITEKGKRNGEAAETSLPYSVRRKASKLIKPIAEKMQRDAMIETSSVVGEGGCTVSLSLSDGKGEIVSLNLLVPDEEMSEGIERAFRADAEGIYAKIIDIFIDRQDEK